MGFDFSLHAVLHLRQSIERQQELRLHAANQQVARVQRGIAQVDARTHELQAAQSRDLSSGITAAELRFGLQCVAKLLRQRQELDLQRIRLEQLRDLQLATYQQARRSRQTLEAVRDQQLRLYQKEAARRQQRDLDDLFLLRREYLRRG